MTETTKTDAKVAKAEEKKITFADLGLSDKLLKAIEKKGYEYPSPIQAWVIPLLLKGDRDIIGQAQTGTGKTASFGLPLLDRLDEKKRGIQAIVMCPTRELAIQVAKEIESFTVGRIKITLLYGGQNVRDEIRNLKNGTHIVVGTPGRIKDHLMRKKTLILDDLDYFILDEADEMLNIGFREEIEEILEHTPEDKKTLLFSATMPKEILRIAKKYMKDYDTIAIKSDTTISDRIDQSYYEVAPRNKFESLCMVVDMAEDFYGIVFCKTKLDVDDVASRLMAKGLRTEGIHGDIEQKTREKILGRFKAKKTDILVATDVAARGLDVNDLTHVINYSLPDSPETYTHRIGRTARAGKTGTAISFISRSDKRKLFAVERILKQKIPRGKTPDAKEVVAAQKKRLVGNITNLINDEKLHNFSDIADSLLSLGDPKMVISALLKDAHNDKFDEKSYRITESRTRDNDRGERSRASFSSEADEGEQRLFVAKWKSAGMAPGSLIKFLEKEVGIHLWDVGKIAILDKFSYINVKTEIADDILAFFKAENPRQPLVVQAKPRTGWGGWGRSGGYRGGWNRWGGSRSGGSRGYAGWSRNRGRSSDRNR